MIHFIKKRAALPILLAFLISIFVLTIYSYSLVDLNFTLINSDLWESFRSAVIQIGYFKRDISWIIYAFLIAILFFFHYLMVKHTKEINVLKLAFCIGFILLFSYNFLSHDFFNYMFDAKIVTFYQQNPYLTKALDYAKYADTWLRFMHWTHRTYPYGPSWLAITLIPSFLSFGKLILNFLFFKAMFVGFYLLAIFYLNKMKKEWAVFFATNPLILIEGIVSPHNDLVALSLAIIAIFYLFKKGGGPVSRILFFIGAMIKYMTLPLIFLNKNKGSRINYFIFILQIIILLAVSAKIEIQPWYFLTLFAFLPFYDKLIYRLNIFFAGLLFSYYPYIKLGGWDSIDKIILKRYIILIFFCINLIWLWYNFKKNDYS